MIRSNDGNDQRTSEQPRLPTSGANLKLLVLRGNSFVTHVLPESGVIRIGRSPSVLVPLDDPAVSREHAAIHIGTGLGIEDLGSTNGTRIRDRPLEPGRIEEFFPGDIIEIGSTLMLVQPGATSIRPRRLWTQGHFEGLLEDECDRAKRAGHQFALAHLQVDGELEPRQVEELVASSIRGIDRLASYGPRQYQILFLEAGAESWKKVVRRITDAFQERATPVRIGVARFPEDGTVAEDLVAAACARARGAEAERSPSSAVVRDEAMRRIHTLIARIAPSDISVILLGETGVGKEVLAETLHRRSGRADGPFLRLSCVALPENLLESELFGHEKGSFTGAANAKPGLLETAHGGTVFLDEVGELPLSTQAKLLRVIETREVQRVGGLRPRRIDVRFVSATHRDLETHAQQGTFRQDLYFRLNGISVVIPPLRERRAEIAELARQFIAEASRRAGHPAPDVTPQVSTLLGTYGWPGNIRELRNIMERAVVLSAGETITTEHLPVDKMAMPLTTPAPARSRPVLAAPAVPRSMMPVRSITQPLSPVPFPGADEDEEETVIPADPMRAPRPGEYERIVEALSQCGGNQTQAAKLLGISRRTLVSRLGDYGLPRPRKPR